MSHGQCLIHQKDFGYIYNFSDDSYKLRTLAYIMLNFDWVH